MTFAEKSIAYHKKLEAPFPLKNGVDWIDVYKNKKTIDIFSQFMKTYYNDDDKRNYLFGINPGRFGAGITGVAFTDPLILEEKLGIKNDFDKKYEISAQFIYEVIDQFESIASFYKKFYITSLNPIGLIKDNKNYNYYDDASTQSLIEPFIVQSITTQIKFGCNTDKAFSIGQGKNFKIFRKLNDEHQWFDKIIPLPHPRWVMQYRRKTKEKYVEEYMDKLELK